MGTSVPETLHRRERQHSARAAPMQAGSGRWPDHSRRLPPSQRILAVRRGHDALFGYVGHHERMRAQDRPVAHGDARHKFGTNPELHTLAHSWGR